ncbi:MAG: translation elongation factor Ts [Mycoplasmataceae bacterium]|nr:translation elongation factor Ts [Mycoplasmataceae bacterium]
MASMDLIKKLRDMTQAGVMDAVKALKECGDDLDKAAAWLREKGIAKAAKKAGAVVTEGLAKAIASGNYAAIMEINCQTDFVAAGDNFQKLTNEIMSVIANVKPQNLDELLAQKLASGMTIAEECTNLTAKIGEKICIRRLTVLTKTDEQDFQVYEHFNGKIAVVLLLSNKTDAEVGKSIAMHTAAMNPKFLNASEVDQEWIKNETEILRKQTLAEGKPENRVDMIVKGRIQKSLAEVCLEQQAFIKDPSKTIKTFLDEKHVQLIKFVRYEVGEGVEKVQTNFADEVAAQMGK